MKSYNITKKQYNYLLPVFGASSNNFRLLCKIYHKIDKFYFIGTYEEYLDVLNRCKYLND